jgi:HEAT repeat protein
LEPGQDAAVIRSLEARLADASSVPAEFPEVRAAAAIALGRIADPESLPVLRHWYAVEGPSSSIGRSCGWAIMQMTGEALPEAVAPTQQVVDWFLQPLAVQ